MAQSEMMELGVYGLMSACSPVSSELAGLKKSIKWLGTFSQYYW
jgi:hypothetical protein